MPQPPILPGIDWEAVFESGKGYSDWIRAAESKENAEKMEALKGGLVMEPHTVAFLRDLARPVYAVAIAEDWCGDVQRHVPVLQRLSELAPNLRVRFIARAQHPDVFVRFLTNGGEAIPKFIFLNDAFVECGNWGPMPRACREIIARGKACGDLAAARAKVSALYQADANLRIVVGELIHLLAIAAALEP